MAKPSAIKPLGKTPRFVKMMIAAMSGFGKTVFAGTAPDCLFLTTDPEGTVSASAFGSTAEEWKIHKWQDMNDAYVWVRDEGVKLYKWVVVDNVTEAQAMAMQEAMDIAVKNKPQRDPFVPDKYEYQRSQNATLQMIKKFIDLPINVIFTSHIARREDGEGEDFFSIILQGKQGELAETVLGHMNIIGMGEVIEKDGKEVRRIWFTHHKQWRGKDRFNKLGRFKDDLTIPKMMQIINGPSTAATKTLGTTPRRGTATRKKA